ncbi:hypothetical protein [Achromobacter sp. UMC46]|uniref:hypothetical protein n=1 Tax=Achromobacter sp. UMC46 TaxID=1862319 RepID=UPI0016042DF5|nr:hypothetical protein [Achromobacter sp. UMC46]MBB1596489.1 hypothetical protein [Achromobacter sp. UMC46]
MTARAACLLSCLFFAGVAQAGSAPAELSCVSESGKVALKGVVPSPSSEDLNIKLSYFDADLTFNSDTAANSYVVSDFPQSVFTLLVPSAGTALTLYALPSTVVVDKNADGDIVGAFQAKLTAPRPRSAAGAQTGSPLKATLNCDYRYSL